MTKAHKALDDLAANMDNAMSEPEYTDAYATVRKALLTGMEAAELSGIIANYRGRYGSDPGLEALSSKVNAIAGFLE